MGIKAEDIYWIESKLIGLVLENEDEGLGKNERILSKIQGIHTTAACVIAEIEKEQAT